MTMNMENIQKKDLIIDQLISGKSAAANELKRLMKKVSPTSSTALILGPTGSGKELVARGIHEYSGRKGPLISVNCAAIPSELLESELFGHEKGSFTGADKARSGKFELSSGGSLFLDEIGDMPLSLQSKLLRAIEGRSIQRVGGDKEIKIDLRLICATHQNIETYVEEGKFRADLFYRINVFPIIVPSLAERSVDIPEIVQLMLKDLKLRGENTPMFDQGAFKELSRYNWPGNVRELRNVVERATVLFPGNTISSENIKENLLRLKVPDVEEEQNAIWDATSDLSFSDDNEMNNNSPPLPHANHYTDWFQYHDNIDLRRHLMEVEEVLIKSAIEKNNGHITHASKCLKINRTTLIEKMKKLSINPSSMI